MRGIFTAVTDRLGARNWHSWLSRRFATAACALALALLALVLFGAAQAQAAGPTRWHTVRADQSVGGIASQYGVAVEELMRLNDLPDASVVRAGQRLLIPERPLLAHHRVGAGETLGSIAKRYGVTVDSIVTRNQIDQPDRIEVGQELTITLAPDAMNPGDFPIGPLDSAEITPWPVPQGRTAVLMVTSSRPVTITATFNGQNVPFVSEGLRHWALLGMYAMATPGMYAVQLHASPIVTATAGGITASVDLSLPLYVEAGSFATYDVVLPPSTGKSALLEPKLVQSEQALVNTIFAGRSPDRRWDGRFDFPLPPQDRVITSEFGERRSYNGGPVSGFHEGTDYGTAEGQPVSAAAGGLVVLARTLDVRGNAIIIDHGYGVFTGYWHLSELDVQVGDTVHAGSRIGLVGTTGLSTGSHLHWEMRVGGVAVDASQWTTQPLL